MHRHGSDDDRCTGMGRMRIGASAWVGEDRCIAGRRLFDGGSRPLQEARSQLARTPDVVKYDAEVETPLDRRRVRAAKDISSQLHKSCERRGLWRSTRCLLMSGRRDSELDDLNIVPVAVHAAPYQLCSPQGRCMGQATRGRGREQEERHGTAADGDEPRDEEGGEEGAQQMPDIEVVVGDPKSSQRKAGRDYVYGSGFKYNSAWRSVIARSMRSP